MESLDGKQRVGVVSSHPIQYQVPWLRELAKHVDLHVFFAYQPSAKQQGEGFGKAFKWDLDLLSGYEHEFLENISGNPGSERFGGCDTPGIFARLAEEKFDVVIVNGWYLKSYWQAIRACRKLGVPVLVRGDSQLGTPRSSLKGWLKEFVYRILLKQFSGFLTVGQRNTEYLEYYSVPKEKIFPAPHYVNNDWFAQRCVGVDRSEVRRRWGASDDELVILFVGKFIHKKRPMSVLQAMQRLGDSLNGKLVYIGSGELEDELHEVAATMDNPPVFDGFRNQTELPECYFSADVLVLPSDGGETWGLVVNEAMACGTPAIVSDACGCAPDLIENGVTGFSFPLDDQEALANAIRQTQKLNESGHDWKPALQAKLKHYSIAACVDGTRKALAAVSR